MLYLSRNDVVETEFVEQAPRAFRRSVARQQAQAPVRAPEVYEVTPEPEPAPEPAKPEKPKGERRQAKEAPATGP